MIEGKNRDRDSSGVLRQRPNPIQKRVRGSLPPNKPTPSRREVRDEKPEAC